MENTLLKGAYLSENQKAKLTFRGAKNEQWVKNHSFWFKNGEPSQDQGFKFPVMTSTSHLPF